MPLSRRAWAIYPIIVALPPFVVASFPLNAPAQEAPFDAFAPPTVTVTATRLPTPVAEVGSSVTVITADEIESRQERTLPDILNDVPGLTVVQTGGPGGTASVFMRGTNPNQTKVLIDGIDVSDPSAPDGVFDFAHILASDIDRIEVLRGPQSGLYGSDAIGGVINIITKQGSGPPKFVGSLEGGSFGTFNQTAGASGSVARFNYAFNVAHFHVDGVQVTPSDLVPPGRTMNKDSYDNETVSTKLGAALGEDFDVGLVARYTDTTLHFTGDDFIGPESLTSESDTQQLFTRGTAHLVSFDGRFDQTVGLAYTHHRSRDFDPNPASEAGGDDPSTNSGDRLKFDWQGNLKITPEHTLILGAEHQIDSLSDTNPTTASVNSDAGFIQLQSSFDARLFDTISLRYDSNEEFGGKATYRIAPAFLIPETGTKLKASLGTGFRAPSLDELYDNYPQFDFFGNPNLRPETSLGYDFGFDETLLDRRVQFGSTYFHNDIHDLITFNDSFTTLINIGQATTWGAESFLAVKPYDWLQLRADHTYTVAEDDILHAALERRPRNKASFTGTWQATAAASLSLSLLRVGPWIDSNRDGTVTGLVASGYTVVNLAGSYDVGHGVTAFARIDNLLDRHYQDPTGFLRPGLGVFVGLRVAFEAAAIGQ